MGPPPAATAATFGSPGTWRSPTFAAKLQACLVQKAESVQPPRRELATGCVERQLPRQGDPPAPFDEGPALTLGAEAQLLEPDHGEDAESVVELGQVHVLRSQVRAFPHARGPHLALAKVVMSSNWSQLGLPRSAVPTAFTWQATLGASGA